MAQPQGNELGTGVQRGIADEQVLQQCFTNFSVIAEFQGRMAYCLASVHVLNPDIWYSICSRSPDMILLANMIYGVTMMIYSRPIMMPINKLNRLTFSVLGSLMFNYSSIMGFQWLRAKLGSDRRILATIGGYLLGRLFMINFMAYMYHVDRCARLVVHRHTTFDSVLYN